MHSGRTSLSAAGWQCIHALRECRKARKNCWNCQRRCGELQTIVEFTSVILAAHLQFAAGFPLQITCPFGVGILQRTAVLQGSAEFPLQIKCSFGVGILQRTGSELAKPGIRLRQLFKMHVDFLMWHNKLGVVAKTCPGGLGWAGLGWAGLGWDRLGWPGRHLSPGPRIPAFYFLESTSCGPRPFTTSSNSDFLPADLKLNPALPNGNHRLKKSFISPQKMAFDRRLS